MALDLGIDIVDHGDGMDDECIERLLETDTPVVPSMLFPARLLAAMGGGGLGFTDDMRHDIDAMAGHPARGQRRRGAPGPGRRLRRHQLPPRPLRRRTRLLRRGGRDPGDRRADLGDQQRRRGARAGRRARHGHCRQAGRPPGGGRRPGGRHQRAARSRRVDRRPHGGPTVTDRLAACAGPSTRAARRAPWILPPDRRRAASASPTPSSTLVPEEWEAPSLCGGWSVHVVAAHLNAPWAAHPEGAPRGRPGPQPRRRVRPDRPRVADPARSGGLRGRTPGATPTRRSLRRGLVPRRRFTDVLVHGADMLQPLGRSVEIDPVALATSLEWLARGRAKGFVPKGRVDGLAFEASDLEFRGGPGQSVVRGPALALCASLCGRGADARAAVGRGPRRTGQPSLTST